jgi:nucleoside-diphosphate-sugar epimerase
LTVVKVTGERSLVTGALGCIGAWTVRALVREKLPVVAFDELERLDAGAAPAAGLLRLEIEACGSSRPAPYASQLAEEASRRDRAAKAGGVS